MPGKSRLFGRLRPDHAERAAVALERGEGLVAAGHFAKGGQHHRAAELYAEAGDRERAVLEAFRAALGSKAQIDPDSTLEQAAELLASTGNRKESVALFELAGAFHQAAKAALKSGQTFRAGRCFERAKLWTRAATCFEKAGQPNEALRVLEIETQRLRQVLQRLPNSQTEQHLRRVVQKRANLLTSLGRQEEAADILEGPRPQQQASGEELEAGGDLRAAVDAYEAAGEHQAALRLVRRIPGFDRRRLAEVMLAAGQPAQAARVFNAVGETQRAAEAFEAAGQWQQAAACWETMRQLVNAGKAYLKAGIPDEAKRCYAAAGRDDLVNHVEVGASLTTEGANTSIPASVTETPVRPMVLESPANSGLQGAGLSPAPTLEPEAQPGEASKADQGGETEAQEPVPEQGLSVGQILADRYRILDIFERFGRPSYKAADREVGEIVEIRAHPFPGTGLQIGKEQLAELRASQTLISPCILRVHDARRINGSFYITRELVEGERLDRRLAGGGAFPLAEVKRIAAHIAEGLREAHLVGLLHRSLRPSNILLTADGARVMDFGLSGFESLAEVARSREHRSFLAPEQLRGEPAQVGSDLYSLGAVIFAMLKGEVPESGPGEDGLQIPASKTYRQGLPVSWEVLLRRLLAPSPEARYVDAGALCRSLATLPEFERSL